MDDWTGKTVVCIGGGPSVTKSQIDLIEKSGLKTIAVNSSWKVAPFCDVIYAADAAWWDAYGKEVDIDAERWTCSENGAKRHGINRHGRFTSALNSGLRAIQFALNRNAERVLLIGYDCSVKNGVHHYGPHTKTGNPTDINCRKWQKQFNALDLDKSKVINCSEYTELMAFQRGKLEDYLC